MHRAPGGRIRQNLGAGCPSVGATGKAQSRGFTRASCARKNTLHPRVKGVSPDAPKRNHPAVPTFRHSSFVIRHSGTPPRRLLIRAFSFRGHTTTRPQPRPRGPSFHPRQHLHPRHDLPPARRQTPHRTENQIPTPPRLDVLEQLLYAPGHSDAGGIYALDQLADANAASAGHALGGTLPPALRGRRPHHRLPARRLSRRRPPS